MKIGLGAFVSISLLCAQFAFAQDDSAAEEKSDEGRISSVYDFEVFVIADSFSRVAREAREFDSEAPPLPKKTFILGSSWSYMSISNYYGDEGGSCELLSDETLFCIRKVPFKRLEYVVMVGFSNGPKGIEIYDYSAFGVAAL